MFRKMRRSDKALSNEETKKLLKIADYGVLCMNGSNGYPYSVALHYAYDDEFIYFHSALTGAKVELLDTNNKVCFSVVCDYEILKSQFDTNYHSAVVFGRATLLDGDDKKNALILLIKKYSPEYYEEGMKYIDKALNATNVYKIDIDHITGKFQN